MGRHYLVNYKTIRDNKNKWGFKSFITYLKIKIVKFLQHFYSKPEIFGALLITNLFFN